MENKPTPGVLRAQPALNKGGRDGPVSHGCVSADVRRSADARRAQEAGDIRHPGVRRMDWFNLNHFNNTIRATLLQTLSAVRRNAPVSSASISFLYP